MPQSQAAQHLPFPNNAQERQQLQQCAVHALNSLLQRRAFTARDLDGIADGLVLQLGQEAGEEASCSRREERTALGIGELLRHPHRQAIFEQGWGGWEDLKGFGPICMGFLLLTKLMRCLSWCDMPVVRLITHMLCIAGPHGSGIMTSMWCVQRCSSTAWWVEVSVAACPHISHSTALSTHMDSHTHGFSE